MCGGETRATLVVVVVVSVVVVVMLLRVPSAVRYRYTPQMRIGVRGDGPSKHLDLVGFRLHDQVHLLSFAIPNFNNLNRRTKTILFWDKTACTLVGRKILPTGGKSKFEQN